MTMDSPSSELPFSIDHARSIDALCDEFEAAWVAGQRPRLEEFAARVPERQRESVLRELLAIELHHRRRRGEAITPSDYAQRFPQWKLTVEPAAEAERSARPQRSPLDPAREGSTVMLPASAPPPKSQRYHILKMHARGGMGEIWLADDLEIGRRVAYKRVRDGRDEIEERFFSEAQITGQLEHPGVVPVHELGHDGEGNPFYVMRLVQGQTLKEVISQTHAEIARHPKSRELCWLRLLEIFLAVCRTVAYAHHRGVIHRDIKPDNIMIGSYGETIVVDWGLAKVLQSPDLSVSKRLSVQRVATHGSSATQDGNVVGSPQYMSPEMAEGRVADADIKTDVYLLGATLYEILTCRPPRQGSSQEEVLNLARTTLPKPPRQVAAHVPRALEAICLRAMSRDKGERYESAQELAAEVERYLVGDPVHAYRESWSERLGRWLRRHRRAVGRAAALILLVASVTVAAVAWQRAERRAQLSALAVQRHEQLNSARQDAASYERLAERLRYWLTDTTPLDERLSFSDPTVATQLQTQLRRIESRWGKNFATFPLPDEQAQLRRCLAELTLWRVQQAIARPVVADQATALLAELDQIVGLNPSPASYQRLRSTCLLLAGKSDLAAEALALSKQAKVTAFDHFLFGERQRAVALAYRAHEEAPDENEDENEEEPSTWRSNRRGLREAIAAYERSLQLDPAHFWSRLQKGRCHLVCEQIEAAVSEFDQAVALRPDSPWAWSVRGFAWAILHKPAAAEHDLNYALQLEPEFLPAQLNRALLPMLRGQVKESQIAIARLSEQYSDSVQARYCLALTAHAAGDHEAASNACSKILDTHPQLLAPRLLRAQASLALGKWDEASADLDQWLGQRETNLDLKSARAALIVVVCGACSPVAWVVRHARRFYSWPCAREIRRCWEDSVRPASTMTWQVCWNHLAASRK